MGSRKPCLVLLTATLHPPTAPHLGLCTYLKSQRAKLGGPTAPLSLAPRSPGWHPPLQLHPLSPGLRAGRASRAPQVGSKSGPSAAPPGQPRELRWKPDGRVGAPLYSDTRQWQRLVTEAAARESGTWQWSGSAICPLEGRSRRRSSTGGGHR